MIPAKKKAKELVANFIGGHYSSVIDEFKAMSPLQAAMTAAYCMNYLPSEVAAHARKNALEPAGLNIGTFMQLLNERM
ncbi:MAG: hypothetical protein ACYTA5_23120 [Planctomycetota bacterium]